MSKPPPIRSQDAPFDDVGWETVKADITTLSLAVQGSTVLYLTGSDRNHMPVDGIAQVYMTSNTATAGSTGAAYHVIKCLRSGQDTSGRLIDTRQAELPAYTQRFLGTFQVGAGDTLALSLVVTGAPAPTLTTANLCMLVALTPTGST